MNARVAFTTSTLLAWALACGCAKAPAQAEPLHAVAVQVAEALTQPVTVDWPAQALAAGPDRHGLRDYWVDLDLPAGAQADLARGAEARLPLVHHQRVLASLAKMDQGRARLLLPAQVQDLDQRPLRVELALKPLHLFRLPLAAVYAPRSGRTQVFALRQGRVALLDVQVLGLLEQGRVLAAAPGLRPGEPVACQGLDNLLDGDPVRVLPAEVEP